jgi:homoserine dehydrogenase
MTDPLRIAVAGVGTVGAETLRLLQENADIIAARGGRPIVVTAVSARDRTRDRGIGLDGIQWFDDAAVLAKEAEADVVVELIGGADGIAKQICEIAIGEQRHVVTSNKALIAHHGTAFAIAAEAAGVSLGFEAAVAGGIPIIKSIREGLAANKFKRVYGILNGTCNYILTNMRLTGRAFDVVLAEAQERGYAEADPTLDVDGIDTGHKLAILASVAFGTAVNFEGVHMEGISHVDHLDIVFAEELGYRIKLLGVARLTDDGLEQRVHPCMVPLSDPIAHIDDVFNAVVVDGDHIGTTMQEGRGAGAEPTASAVVADLIDIARGRMTSAFSVKAENLTAIPVAPMGRHRGAYYVRLMVVDQPGVFADVAAVMRARQVSMESILQRARAPGHLVPVVMTLHETNEGVVTEMLNEIAELDVIVEPPCMIRIESFRDQD